MSDKNIDWIKRLQLLEKALKENKINSSVCVELDAKISGYELDFSEHDKVFEDKIASLEKVLSSVVKEAERQEFIREMSCLERQCQIPAAGCCHL